MYALVYQCGLANVFHLPGGKHAEPLRVLQHSFDACEWFCRGLEEAGYKVGVFHSDLAGDVRMQYWTRGPGGMFSDAKRPPKDTEAA